MLDVIILVAIPDLTQSEFDILSLLVSSEKRDRIKRFHFYHDAQNCLLGDVLARSEICRTTNFTNEQLEFSVNAYGKPILLNSPHIHFNISHTGHYIAFAMSDEPVGIDIELIKPFDKRIAEQFFTPEETSYIMAEMQNQVFYEVWTKKESYIKLEGKGMHIPLNSFSVLDYYKQVQLTYHKIFQSYDAVCHVCSTKKATTSVKIIDTVLFLQNGIHQLIL